MLNLKTISNQNTGRACFIDRFSYGEANECLSLSLSKKYSVDTKQNAYFFNKNRFSGKVSKISFSGLFSPFLACFYHFWLKTEFFSIIIKRFLFKINNIHIQKRRNSNSVVLTTVLVVLTRMLVVLTCKLVVLTHNIVVLTHKLVVLTRNSVVLTPMLVVLTPITIKLSKKR